MDFGWETEGAGWGFAPRERGVLRGFCRGLWLLHEFCTGECFWRLKFCTFQFREGAEKRRFSTQFGLFRQGLTGSTAIFLYVINLSY